MTPEGRVKAKVNRAISQLGRAYKFMPVQNGMGAPGLDYYCCLGGLFVAIETKVLGKDLTDRQKITRDQIEAAGGMVFVIHDQAEIDLMLAQIALHLRFAPKGGDGHVRDRTELHREAPTAQERR